MNTRIVDSNFDKEDIFTRLIRVSLSSESTVLYKPGTYGRGPWAVEVQVVQINSLQDSGFIANIESFEWNSADQISSMRQ